MRRRESRTMKGTESSSIFTLTLISFPNRGSQKHGADDLKA